MLKKICQNAKSQNFVECPHGEAREHHPVGVSLCHVDRQRLWCKFYLWWEFTLRIPPNLARKCHGGTQNSTHIVETCTTKQEVVTCHWLVILHWQSDTSPPFWHLCPTEIVRITTKTMNLPSKSSWELCWWSWHGGCASKFMARRNLVLMIRGSLKFYFVLEESHILFHAKSSDRVGRAYKFREPNKICQNQWPYQDSKEEGSKTTGQAKFGKMASWRKWIQAVNWVDWKAPWCGKEMLCVCHC